jgi:hypothetical protein
MRSLRRLLSKLFRPKAEPAWVGVIRAKAGLATAGLHEVDG